MNHTISVTSSILSFRTEPWCLPIIPSRHLWCWLFPMHPSKPCIPQFSLRMHAHVELSQLSSRVTSDWTTFRTTPRSVRVRVLVTFRDKNQQYQQKTSVSRINSQPSSSVLFPWSCSVHYHVQLMNQKQSSSATPAPLIHWMRRCR